MTAPLWLPAQGRSMWPLGPPLELCVLPVDLLQLRPGDLVALVGHRPGEIWVHRLVAVTPTTLVTRGDTLAVADPPWPLTALVGRVTALRCGPLVLPVPTGGLPAEAWRAIGRAWANVAPGLRSRWRKLGRRAAGRKC